MRSTIGSTMNLTTDGTPRLIVRDSISTITPVGTCSKRQYELSRHR
jgi:hypothetical protein